LGIRPTLKTNFYSYKAFSAYAGLGISIFWLLRDEIEYHWSYGNYTIDLAESGPYSSLSLGAGLTYTLKIGKLQFGVRFHSDTEHHRKTIVIPNLTNDWILEKDVLRKILLIETSYYYEF